MHVGFAYDHATLVSVEDFEDFKMLRSQRYRPRLSSNSSSGFVTFGL